MKGGPQWRVSSPSGRFDLDHLGAEIGKRLADPGTGEDARQFETRRPAAAHPSEEGLQPGLRAAEDQRMDVVRALVGVDRLEVQHVAHDVVLFLNAVAAVHVARLRAMSSALPQLLRLTSEIISGAALPSSSRRPTRSEA